MTGNPLRIAVRSQPRLYLLDQTTNRVRPFHTSNVCIIFPVPRFAAQSSILTSIWLPSQHKASLWALQLLLLNQACGTLASVCTVVYSVMHVPSCCNAHALFFLVQTTMLVSKVPRCSCAGGCHASIMAVTSPAASSSGRATPMPQRQAGAQHMRGPPLRMTARKRSVGRQSQPTFPGEDAPGTGESMNPL